MNRLSRAHERYIRQTDDRQTDDRQTDGRAIAYSEREREFTFAKNLKSYVAYKSRLKLAARAVLSADAGLLVTIPTMWHRLTDVLV